jgi:hypothetical protein
MEIGHHASIVVYSTQVAAFITSLGRRPRVNSSVKSSALKARFIPEGALNCLAPSALYA